VCIDLEDSYDEPTLPPAPPSNNPNTTSHTIPLTRNIEPGIFLLQLSKITPIIVPPNIDVLLIGDSNLRSFTKVPPSWLIVCIPGLYLYQLTTLLQLLPKAPPLKHIIISAGINDKDSSNVSVVTECLRAARRPGTTIHFQCINYSKRLDPQQIFNLQGLNKTAGEGLGVKLIPRLTDPLVFKDFPPIHHDNPTAARILEETISHIAALNC
jgi:hypothetical protein